MSQHYSDPSRETDPYALPDVEVFYMTAAEARQFEHCGGSDDDPPMNGWYYWYIMPGCLPDSEPFGPFATEQDAINAMRFDAE